MKNVQVINKLTGRMLKTSKRYRQAILDSLDESIDEMRDVTEKEFLIPDRYKNKGLRYKLKHQKSHPTKLTSRTGALKKMIYTGKRKWRKGTSTHKSESPAVQCKSRTTNKNTAKEMYEGTIGYIVKNPSAISSKRTKAQLIGRFLWDTPRGIKGKRRPLFTGAADKVGLRGVEENAKRRLAAIGVS